MIPAAINWIHLWPAGPPAEPYMMANLGAAYVIRRFGGSVIAEFPMGAAIILHTGGTDLEAQARMKDLAEAIGAYNPYAVPPMPLQPYSWLYHAPDNNSEWLINYRLWHGFWRTTAQQMPGQFAVQGQRPGMAEYLAHGLTDQESLDMLAMLQATTGAVPKP